MSVPADRDSIERLLALPRLPLIAAPTPIDDLSRLRAAPVKTPITRAYGCTVKYS